MSDKSARHTSTRQMMASTDATAGRATVGAGHLHTPEERLYDSFTQGNEKVTCGTKLAPVKTLSPPISPENNVLPSFASTTSHQTQDEILFPDTTQSDSQAPLFDSQNQHSESQEDTTSAPAAPLKRLQLSTSPGVATVRGTKIQVERSPKGARSYYDSCMASLEGVRYAQRAAGTLPFPQRSSAQPRDAVSARQVHMLLTRPAGVTKPAKPTKPASPLKAAALPKLRTPKVAPAAPLRLATPDKAAAPSRRSRTPHKRSNSDFLADAFPGDNEKKHKRAPPTKQTPSKESDLHWQTMPDFAPPLSSLDEMPNRLRGVWGGPNSQPLNIDDDQDAEFLGPVEMELAATLRLKPVQYLSNKRRIFEAKVQSLRDNKTFTKTAAQSACNIDVNKASALWTAFDKVGWFERKWFEQHL